jgi:predicted HAD superfamily hydrolase
MNSWDCFDTLVARRFYHPHTVFDEVGKRLGIENFREMRVQAELNSDSTYAGIYKNLPGLDPSVEQQVELEHCFPIVENINRVQNGDIIVSDIYYNSSFVEKILRNCGLTKDVKFFVTPDGKSKGWIWSQLPGIKLHIGDNPKSDVKSPGKFNILSELYTETHFTEIEKEVSNIDLNLALWMRFIRLQCPYSDKHQKSLWIDQANLNLPILVLASFELPDKPIAFTYRDCIFWQPIYEKLTNKKSIRFDSSRMCLRNPTKE